MYTEKSGALAADINTYIPPKGETAVWWLGQSGFVIKAGGFCLVTDPYLSTTLEDMTKDMTNGMRHIRMMPIAVEPSALHCVDYILCSHDHGDHYDGKSVKGLLAGSPGAKVIVPPAAVPSLLRDGIAMEKIIPVGAEDTYTAGTLRISALRAKHNQFDYSQEYGYPYVGYIIRISALTIYHGGDTILFDELPDLLKRERIDIGIMAINGYDDQRIALGFQSNCTYSEAAELAKYAGIRCMIPCHYDMFTANTEQVGKYVNYMNQGKNMPKYLLPVIGEALKISL